jgi:hypothetical protein
LLFGGRELASSDGFRGGTEQRVKRNASRPTLTVAASHPAIRDRGGDRTPIDDAFPGYGIEASLPQTLPATERATTGETSAMQGSNSLRQASPKNGADGALDGQDTKPLIERERQLVAASVHVSSCFPSASAVRQDHPEAWPSWTLRAPGHEGTKCWYAAASRPTAGDHRGETIAKKDAVGTIEKLGSPGEIK